MKDINSRPLAAPGLISYRCKNRHGWTMIGASDDLDAMAQAKRSDSDAKVEDLQVWNGTAYQDCVAQESPSMKDQQMKPEHIAEISTADTGGGLTVDLITLNDGRIVGISGDAVVLYDSLDDFQNNEARERPMIALGGATDTAINVDALEKRYIDAADALRSKQVAMDNFASELHAFIKIRDDLREHSDFSGRLPQTYFSGGDLDPDGDESTPDVPRAGSRQSS